MKKSIQKLTTKAVRNATKIKGGNGGNKVLYFSIGTVLDNK